MSKSVALLLVLVFLTASSTAIAEPATSSAETKENSWTTKAPMPEGVSIVKAAVVNGKIYAMTGSYNYEYDPATDTWIAKKPVPTPRHARSFGIAAYQDKIYVIGGNNGSSGYTNYLSTNEVYDPSTDTWETKKPMPTSREQLDASVVNGKIYLIGGITDNYHSISTAVNEVYDTTTDTWTTKQPAPSAVANYASAVIDNKIYIMSGTSNQIYDAENDTWSLGAPLPTATYYAAAGATTGVKAPKRIYLVGGGFSEITNVVNVYDPALDTWSAGAALPTNRTSHAVAVVNDVLYAMGGAVGWHGEGPPYYPPAGWTLTNTVDQYIPFGYGTIPPEPFPTTLVVVASGASAVAVGAGILVYFKKRKR